MEKVQNGWNDPENPSGSPAGISPFPTSTRNYLSTIKLIFCWFFWFFFPVFSFQWESLGIAGLGGRKRRRRKEGKGFGGSSDPQQRGRSLLLHPRPGIAQKPLEIPGIPGNLRGCGEKEFGIYREFPHLKPPQKGSVERGLSPPAPPKGDLAPNK